MKSPQLVAFQVCRQAAIDQLGEANVYDDLPQNKVQYPFLYIGEMQGVDKATKSAYIPTIFQTIHYYGNMKKRGTATKMMVDLMEQLRAVREYEGYKIHCRDIKLQMLTDNSTSTPLLHGVLDVEFVIY